MTRQEIELQQIILALLRRFGDQVFLNGVMSRVPLDAELIVTNHCDGSVSVRLVSEIDRMKRAVQTLDTFSESVVPRS